MVTDGTLFEELLQNPLGKKVTEQKQANRQRTIGGIMDAGYMPGQTRPNIGQGGWKIERAN